MADVLLGQDTSTGEGVYLDYEDRPLGVAIIGKSGTGKSSILEHLILADIAAGTPGVVIDPHGQLASNIIQLVPPEVAHRIVLLEVNEEHPFGLNLLEVDTSRPDFTTWAADSVIDTVKKLYGQADEYAPRLEKYLDLAVRALIPNNGTLVAVPKLFRDKAFRHACLRNVRDEEVIGEFAAYDSLRPADQAKEVEAVVNRLGRVLRSTAFRQIIGSKRTTVPFDDVFDGETMLVVSLPSDTLSPDRCDFIGSMLLCAFAQRVFSRSAVSELSRVHLYLDEYQRFATTTTAELLTQGRKYKAGVTMAHQDLASITDPRIRNASRHARTLIALSLIRPDAEQLAGEFPVKPREEWIETLEEIDGTEPKRVYSPTPAEDIYLNGHSDPDVDLAARSFFAFSKDASRPAVPLRFHFEEGKQPIRSGGDPGYKDKRKTAGVGRRPGGLTVDLDVQIPLGYVQGLLIRAMAGELSTDRQLCDALIKSAPRRGHPQSGTLPLLLEGRCFCNESPSRIYDPSLAGDSSWPLTEEEKSHNRAVWAVFDEETETLLKHIRAWILFHVERSEILVANQDGSDFRSADKTLLAQMEARAWTAHSGNGRGFDWHGRVWRFPFPDPIFVPQFSFVEADRDQSGAVSILKDMGRLRQRVRWLYILCRGLERNPVYVLSGEHQPRVTKRMIVHPRQAEQDALNEFASTLVHPPERYVVHVRLPTEYHLTKLTPPVGGIGNAQQVDEVRRRSQTLYQVPDDEPEVPPPPAPGRPIGRRPGPLDPPQDDDPSNEESDKNDDNT